MSGAKSSSKEPLVSSSWPALDVAIGLAFMFALLALVASAANEGIATVLKWRAKFLEQWIGRTLADPSS